MTRLTLEALQVLDSIARCGSFAAAAEELHRVPSAITYTVHKLEQDLDVVLFDRSGHRAVLTPAGKMLLEDGRHLLDAATEVEARVKRVANGWEAELHVAIGDLLPRGELYPLITEFYRLNCGTRLRILAEVFGGCWDALVSRRADLVIGAPNDGPAGGGYVAHPLGEIRWSFVLAPDHPLTAATEPLSREQISRYRAVAAADSSRNLPARSSGVLSGQDVLTVPDMRAKIDAQVLGMGVGFIPASLAASLIREGRLVERAVEEPKPPVNLVAAWRTGERGRALEWFIDRLDNFAIRKHSGLDKAAVIS